MRMSATPEVSIRALDDLSDLRAASALVAEVWGDVPGALAPVGLLRAYARFGNPVLGAFHSDALCGVSIGFLASAGGVHLHSHVTGVLPSHQHLGIGFELKLAQRQWCLDNGIDHITWTFDPLLARNAYFNIRKLRATADMLLPDFYGSMDDDVNRGETTDRLVVRWPITSIRVERAIAGSRTEDGDGSDRSSASTLPPIVRTVAVPGDYLLLRSTDPVEAARARSRVCDELAEGLATGLQVVDFSRRDGYHLAEPLRD